jgi:hypothetical protein
MESTTCSASRQRAVVFAVAASLFVLVLRPPIALAVALATSSLLLVLELVRAVRRRDEALLASRMEIGALTAALHRQSSAPDGVSSARSIASRRRHPSNVERWTSVGEK